MWSPLRSIIPAISLFLAVTLILAPETEASALASPNAFPAPFINADYDGHLAPVSHATRHSVAKKARNFEHAKATLSKRNLSRGVNTSSVKFGHSTPSSYPTFRLFHRDLSNLDDLFESFSGQRDNAVSDSQYLQNLASQSASQNEDDAAFQRDAAMRFQSFQSNMQTGNDILSQLAADKGLANYDKMNQLETMVKDLVNANKDAFRAANVMINNMPALASILGPILYEIKCIVEEVLDIVENLSDAVINDLAPLLGGTGNANDITCQSALKALGLCV